MSPKAYPPSQLLFNSMQPFLTPADIQTPDRLVRSLVTIPTELSHSHVFYGAFH